MSPDASTPDVPPLPEGPDPRRSSRARRFVAFAGVLTAILVTLMVAGPIALASIVAARLGPVVGGEVSIGSVQPADWGERWVVSDLVVRARGWDGLAGEAIRIDRIEAEVEFGSVLELAPKVLHLDVRGGTIRLAERLDAPQDAGGTINLLALVPEATDEEIATTTPTITVEGLRFEAGELIDGRWTLAGHRNFAGEISVDPDAPELLDIKLLETDDEGIALAGALMLTGIVDTGTEEASLKVRDISLGPDALRIAPPSVRRLCEDLDLDGEVKSIDFRWSPGGQLSSSLTVADLAMRLDVDDTRWARFREGRIESDIDAPRMRVTEGRIEIDERRLELADFRGTLGGERDDTMEVPFSLGFSIDLLAANEPDLDWTQRREAVEQVLNWAPFVLDLAITDFGTVPATQGADAVGAIELPLVAARILEKLGARAWELGIDLHVERGQALSYRKGVPVPGDLIQEGRIRLRNGEGAFDRFPYPLVDVRGELAFEGEQVEILEMLGRGPTGADVSISGTLLIPPGDVAVDVRIESSNLPVDEHLLSTLRGGPQRLLEELFHRESVDRLAALELLETEASIASAARQRDVLRRELERLDADDRDRAALEGDLAALERRCDAGPFELGGVVGIDLRFEQALGADAPLITTGSIEVDGNGVLLKAFNYPAIAGRSTIRLEDERIVLEAPGIPFVSPGGAAGLVSGVIDIPRRVDPVDGSGTRGFEPRLEVRIPGDRVNDALLATITPPTWIADPETCPRGWADLVDASGLVDIEGVLLPDPDGGLDPDWAFTADLSGVRGRLRPPLVDAVAALDVAWPPEAVLDGVSGRLGLTPGEVEIVGLAGVLEQPGPSATLAATGSILPREGAIEIEVQCAGLDARTWFEATTAPGTDSMWIRREIAGSIDSRLVLGRADGDGAILASLVGGRITIDGEALPTTTGAAARPRLELALGSGAIEFAAAGTRFLDALVLAGPAGDAPTDQFLLGGTEPIDGETWRFTCDWQAGRLDGPVLRTAIREFLPEFEEGWETFAPEGPFSADIAVGNGGFARLDVASSGSSLLLQGERLAWASERPIRIDVEPSAIEIRFEEATVGAAPAARISGVATVDRSPAATVDFLGEIALDALPSPAFAALPATMRETLDTIELVSESPVAIEDLAVECRWRPGDPPAEPASISVDGTVVVENAAFEAGLAFSEVEGRARIVAVREPGEPLSLRGTVAADRLVVLEREVVDISSRLSWNEREDRLRSEQIEGRVYGGQLRAEVDADFVSERFAIEVHLDEVAAGRLLAGEDPAPRSEDPGRPDARAGGDSGRLRGRVAIEGTFGESTAEPWRIGRGRVSIEEGRIARDPISMSLLQLSQLMLPINDAIADLDAAFHIENDRLALETIELRCDTMVLAGVGEVDLASMTIDSVLEVRGRVPGLSDLMSPIAGLLYAVELGGPISDPSSTLRLLPGLSETEVPPIRMTRVEEAPDP